MLAITEPFGAWIGSAGEGRSLSARCGLHRLALVTAGVDRLGKNRIFPGGSWLVTAGGEMPQGAETRIWLDFGLGTDPRRKLSVVFDRTAVDGPSPPAFASAFSTDLPEIVPPPADACARSVIPAILARLRSRLPGARLQAHNDLDSLLIELAAFAVRESPLPLADRLARAELAMVMGLDQAPGITTMAASAGMSRSAFNQAWRTLRRSSPGAWLAALRIATAERLLATTDLAVGVVARRSGFADASAFARAFNRAKGRPPAEWRQSARTKPKPKP